MRAVLSRRWFRAGDGTRLAWYEGGCADGPPLVFLSGLVTSPDGTPGRDNHLAKPVDLDTVIACIEAHLAPA